MRVDFHLELDSDRELTPTLVAEVNDFCDRVEDAPAAGVAVVRLTGAAMPGAERAWPGAADVHLVSKWERALRRLERFGAASVAVAGGRCAGPALEVLFACDRRIALPDLRLEVPVTDEGVWPGMLWHRLVTQLGVGRARRLLFRHELSAAEAAELGVVDEVTGDPDRAVAAVAAVVRGAAGRDLAVRRRLLLDAAATGFEEALGAHLAACDRTLRRRAEEWAV